jgi:hypothetical protein
MYVYSTIAWNLRTPKVPEDNTVEPPCNGFRRTVSPQPIQLSLPGHINAVRASDLRY